MSDTITPLCPRCGSAMIRRNGSMGPFFGCSTFPECRGTRNIPVDATTATPTAPRRQSEAPSPARNTPAAPEAPSAPSGGVRASMAKFGPDAGDKPKYAPLVKLPGTAEQEAIWKVMLKKACHLVVNAGPGVGKTWSAIQYCLRAPKNIDILFVAFNNHIAAEANGKLTASKCSNTVAKTYHSLGKGILTNAFPSLRGKDPDLNKMQTILEGLSPMPLINKAEWRRTLNLAERLCSYIKNYLIDYTAPDLYSKMESLADRHNLETGTYLAAAVALIVPALDECKKRASVSIDFDDMLWLPVVLNLPVNDPPDVMITDESQDLSPVQHALTMMVAEKGRCLIIGDRRQAIYAWRGASADSMDVLRDQLKATDRGVEELPMTITQRCPKLHVKLAQAIDPNIHALEDAPLGEIITTTHDKGIAMLKPGDMAICRVNAPLVSVAYSLIRRGIRPLVKGRDIGKGLKALIAVLEEALVENPNFGLQDEIAARQFSFENGAGEIGVRTLQEGREMHQLAAALDAYRMEQINKLMTLGEKKAEGRIAALNEKCDCLEEFIVNSKDIDEMKLRIDTIFEKKDGEPAGANTVVLGTVHRTKGLEAERVFILHPELIPHPMAKTDVDIEQERNIAWIACTRAKFDNKTGAPGTIVFCGRIPAIYQTAVAPPPALTEQEEQLDEKAELKEEGQAPLPKEDDVVPF
jgi:DNA helicase-2/ATP-dependent DNA helicase PcrA